ncbi:MAG: tetraacyldisaccharide 4'-kinase [Alphaproteobacteria bacterium]|nr:tetraacyldisaccharide 4'-kinase [Alphaproteobacteria bacterium]MCB9928081.1 tetraacyldisaccharide 4'-kinase [Alphaproteobacteria bacterium]
MRTPEFWQRDSLWSWLLAPAGWLYAVAGWWRWRRARPVRAPVPVVCVGNLVAGGAGKTPTVLALADLLRDRTPHALSRGYGGRLSGVVRVDPARHSAEDVGDEPLLLARHLPAWISRDRPAGARAAAEAGAGLILMDDGFQNPTLAKTVSLLVIDAAQGLGNGRCLPAGPLREPAARGFARADAVVLIGEGSPALPFAGPVFHAHVRPLAAGASWRGRAVVAFAGIARPEKLFATLRTLGADLRSTQAFADHHRFQDTELQALARVAGSDAVLVTTEKDHVRLPADWQKRVEPLPVALQFEDPAALTAWLTTRLASARLEAAP